LQNENEYLLINSISEQHQLLRLSQPEHPLISIIKFHEIESTISTQTLHFSNRFYTITLKEKCTSNEKYGRNAFDFNEGVMIFCAPNKKQIWNVDDQMPAKGWMISLHPDFLVNHPLHKKIKEFGFFQYALNEALHLSRKEEKMIEVVLKNIKNEYHSVIDSFSQDIIISQIETLLNYANRFYNRQFITRKNVNNELLKKLNIILDEFFETKDFIEKGLPTVRYISGQLYLSSDYLSDLLRNLTGQNTQQYIHNKIIEKAKEILLTTNLSVSEIAYQLGFEHPQSFNKLFKSKTNTSPLQFKSTFN